MEPELLHGDNQYRTDNFGKQDAAKGIALASSPSVLVIQLRRYEYDFFSGGMTKLFDRISYPTELDVSTFELYSYVATLSRRT